MKLSRKAAARISDLINSLQVCETFIDRALNQQNHDMLRRWGDAKDDATVELADEFGIELCTLASARAGIAERTRRLQRSRSTRLPEPGPVSSGPIVRAVTQAVQFRDLSNFDSYWRGHVGGMLGTAFIYDESARRDASVMNEATRSELGAQAHKACLAYTGGAAPYYTE